MATTEHEALVADTIRDLLRRPPDFDPLELLHDLTEQALKLLPVQGTGVTVLDGREHVEYATASDERCRHIEQVQIELGEGPCLESVRRQQALAAVELTHSTPGALRWPHFVGHARRAGFIAVAAVPLHTPGLVIGALNLLNTTHPLPAKRDMRLAQALADAAACCFGHRHALDRQAVVIHQLQTALDGRLVIEQAKGVLSERLGLSLDEAFTLLRGHARARQIKLHRLATQVAQGDIPAELDPSR